MGPWRSIEERGKGWSFVWNTRALSRLDILRLSARAATENERMLIPQERRGEGGKDRLFHILHCVQPPSASFPTYFQQSAIDRRMRGEQ